MTTKNEKTEVAVIGAGPAGYVCAIRLAQLGKKVTVIERDALGGVCLNVGCIPSKALIHAGTVYEKMRHAEDFGIKVQGLSLDFKKLISWKSSVVKKLTDGVGTLLKANGCQVLSGKATFLNPRTLSVQDAAGAVTQITFDHCVIATGSRPAVLPGFEVDQETIVDSTGALAMSEKPESLLCIGGGYIGLELGTFFAKIGTRVTVLEAGPSLLGGVDPELTKVVAKHLASRGVDVQTRVVLKSCKKSKKGIEVKYTDSAGKESTLQVEKMLMTVGRVPNTDQLNLKAAGLTPDQKGFLKVDAYRRTSVQNIFAIGDVAGQPLLAHKGSKEGIVAAEVISGKKTLFDVVAIPAVIFTDPEIATVGLSEQEARGRGLDILVGQFPFAANGRALSVGEPDGFVKMIADRRTGILLGVHIVGVEASNLIAEATLALEMGAHVEDLSLTVHAHPTLPETLMEAAEATLGHAIHIFQKKSSTSAHPPQARA